MTKVLFSVFMIFGLFSVEAFALQKTTCSNGFQTAVFLDDVRAQMVGFELSHGIPSGDYYCEMVGGSIVPSQGAAQVRCTNRSTSFDFFMMVVGGARTMRMHNAFGFPSFLAACVTQLM